MLSQGVRPSVRQSITYRCFVETAKHIIKLFIYIMILDQYLALSQNGTKQSYTYITKSFID